MSKETESDEDIDFEAYLENRMEEVGDGHEEDEDLESLLKEAESENKLPQPSAQEQKAAQQRQEQILTQMNNNDAEEQSLDKHVSEVVSEEKVVTLELWQGKSGATEDEEERKINEKLNSMITVKPKEKKKKKLKVPASSSASSSTTSTPSTAKQGSWMAEVIETRISLLVSNVMNRLGKVLTVPSENELIVQQNQELEKAKKSGKEGAQEVIDFANLDTSLQRKILLLEKTVTNMGELLELHIRKEMKQRKQIKKLQKLAIDNENKYIEETNAKEQLKQRIDRIIKVKNQYKKKLAQYEPSVAEQVDEDDNAGETTSVLSSIWGVVSSYAASATALPKPQEKQSSTPQAKTAAASSSEPAPTTTAEEQPASTPSPAKKETSTTAPAPTAQQTKEGTPVKKKRVPKPQQPQPQQEASLSEIASSTFAGWKNGALSWFSGKQ